MNAPVLAPLALTVTLAGASLAVTLGEPVKLEAHDRVMVVGIPGTGKSRWTMENIVRNAPRVVVWDPHGEYAERCDLDEYSVDEIADAPGVLDEAGARIAVVAQGWRSLEELAEQFELFADLIKTVENVTIVIDEVGMIDDFARKPIEFLACQSRHFGDPGSPLVLVAQAAVQIPKRARRQATTIVSFCQTEDADIDALRTKFADRADQIPRLPRRKFVLWRLADALTGEEEPKEL